MNYFAMETEPEFLNPIAVENPKCDGQFCGKPALERKAGLNFTMKTELTFPKNLSYLKESGN